jgi:hypothetical protein
LNSLRHTLDSLVRLAGHDRASAVDATGAAAGAPAVDLRRVAERLIDAFDHEPEVKARIAQVLADWDDEGQQARTTPAAAAPHATAAGAPSAAIVAPPSRSPSTTAANTAAANTLPANIVPANTAPSNSRTPVTPTSPRPLAHAGATGTTALAGATGGQS